MLALAFAVLLAQSTPEKPPAPPAKQEKPLSDEDREVVKQMALLEQLELVKTLELFEPEKDGGPPPETKRQP